MLRPALSSGRSRRSALNRSKRSGAVVACLLILGLTPSLAQAGTPSITSMWPRKGPVGRGVFIKGAGFANATDVEFNGKPATFAIRSDNRIRAVVPSGATAGPVTITAEGSTASSPQPFVVQPNIVLILTDDQRFDELDHMPIVQSQLIDKGTKFSNGYVVNPLCCPSRTTILTGKYSHGTDVYSNIPPHGGFQTFVTTNHEDRSTIATWLQKAGYDTGIVGKYLNGYTAGKTAYVSPGWNTWDVLANPGADGGYFNETMSLNGVSKAYGSAPADYSTDVLSGYASDFIESAPPDQPLFLYFAPKAAHPPATPPPRYADSLTDIAPLRPPSYNEADVSDKPAYIQAVPPGGSWAQGQDNLRLHQYQSLLAVDDAVGNIVNALSASGRLQDTLIVFASDNGLSLGEHRWTNKKAPYEEDIRVPVIARYDALLHQTASVDNRFVLNLDFAPTFAAAGGTTAPNAEGVSILPLLDGSATSWRSDFLVEHADTRAVTVPTYCAVHDEQYMYVDYSTGEEELYDLSADPYELQNQASNPDAPYPDVKAAMHARLLQLCSPPPPGFAP
ncbi:MAG: sulfatase-like hydrolase/transferase [Actinomycetota bacterium]